jgi:hypothetical protein
MRRLILLPWFVLSVSLLLLPAAADSQVDFSSVTVRLGMIRTLQGEIGEEDHLWSLSLELQIGGQLFTPSLLHK